MKRELLRYAVSQKMFCECGEILDVDDAVLIITGAGAGVNCCKCFDKDVKKSAKGASLSYVEAVTRAIDNGAEIVDSRIFKKLEGWHVHVE